MFVGQYERNLDEKGRLAIPTEFRTALSDGSVLTRSFDNCLCIYGAAKWDSLSRAIDELPQARPEVRDLARSLFGSAVVCQFDSQGRIVIPVFLREYAELRGEVMVVGVNSRIELWGKGAWLSEQQKFETRGAALAEALTISGM